VEGGTADSNTIRLKIKELRRRGEKERALIKDKGKWRGVSREFAGGEAAFEGVTKQDTNDEM